ncbi:MAG: VRR-NUC domain-containing protein [Solirubrobacteraceae bacterium]
MTEKQFQQQVVDWARFNHWLVYHPHDSRHSAAGFPDLALVRDGRLVFAELKTARGRVSVAQHEWLAALAASGCETHVWRPADWPVIERTLARQPSARQVSAQ